MPTDPKQAAIICVTAALRALDYIPPEHADNELLEDARWSLLTEFETLTGSPWPQDLPAITEEQREAWLAERLAEQRGQGAN